YRLLGEEHAAAAFRNEGYSCAPGICRVAQADIAPFDGELAALGLDLAEEGAGQFDLAAAHEAIDADHFTGPDANGHVAIGTAVGEMFGRQSDGTLAFGREFDLCRVTLLELLMPLADHALNDPALVDARRGLAGDPFAVAQHGHRVCYAQHVVEEM